MTLAEILDRTAFLYRTNFLLFAGIASVYAGAILLIGLAHTGLTEWLRVAHMNRALGWANGMALLITWIPAFIFGCIAGAANNRAVAWLHLGYRATIRGAYQSVLPKAGRFLWLGLLILLFAWLPLILIYGALGATVFYSRSHGILAPAPGAAPGPQSMVFVFVLFGLLLLFLPALIFGIVMWLRYALAVPACVVEDLRARAAIKRSVMLTRQARGRIFLLLLLVILVELALVLFTQGFFIFDIFRHHGELPVGLRLVQQIISFLTTTFVMPMLATGLTLFYFDQRVRKEGFDIEWMMQAAGLTVPPPAPAVDSPAASEPGNPAVADSSPAEPGRSPAGELQ